MVDTSGWGSPEVSCLFVVDLKTVKHPESPALGMYKIRNILSATNTHSGDSGRVLHYTVGGFDAHKLLPKHIGPLVHHDVATGLAASNGILMVEFPSQEEGRMPTDLDHALATSGAEWIYWWDHINDDSPEGVSICDGKEQVERYVVNGCMMTEVHDLTFRKMAIEHKWSAIFKRLADYKDDAEIA